MCSNLLEKFSVLLNILIYTTNILHFRNISIWNQILVFIFGGVDLLILFRANSFLVKLTFWGLPHHVTTSPPHHLIISPPPHLFIILKFEICIRSPMMRYTSLLCKGLIALSKEQFSHASSSKNVKRHYQHFLKTFWGTSKRQNVDNNLKTLKNYFLKSQYLRPT